MLKDSLAFSKRFKFFSVLLFIFAIIFVQNSGTNSRSRLLQTVAICETFPQINYSIDSYVAETQDWSQALSGRYYSNKAPGAAFLSAPLFCPLFAIAKKIHSVQTMEESLKLLSKSYYFFEQLLSLCCQIFPLMALGWVFLKSPFAGERAESLTWSTLILFFGSSASVFANMWFGHTLAAVLLSASLLAFFSKRYALFTLGLGFSILTDYGVIFALPAVAYLLWTVDFKQKILWKSLFQGAVLPMLLWTHYHVQSFGGVLELPQKYTNPIFRDLPSNEGGALWSVMRLFPVPENLLKLFWGQERGLLWTQPWVLLLIVFFVLQVYVRKISVEQKVKQLFVFLFLSLSGLLWMNASFGAWHGGSSSGPRYLIPVLLPWAFVVPLSLECFTPLQRKIFKGSVLYTLILNAGIMASSSVLGPAPLWKMIVQWQFDRPGTFWLRIAAIFASVVIYQVWQRRNSQRPFNA